MSDLIRSTTLVGYDDLVLELGADPRRLRSRFGLEIASGASAGADDEFVSYDAFTGLIAASATDLDCLDFGMRLAERQGMQVLGPVAVMARNAATFHEGVAAIARFMPAHSPALRLSMGAPRPDGSTRLCYDILRRPPYDMRQSYELAMANAVLIVRMLTSGVAGPERIWFPHAPMSSSPVYEEHFGCPVEFEAGWCGLSVPGEVMDRAIDAADPQTMRLAATYLRSEFPDLGVPLSHRVADLIRRLLPTGAYSADVVADQLHLHRRTLQRRLADEGLTYAAVLDDQRRELVVRYLAEPQMQVG